MLSLKRILVPTDFSQHAAAAVEYAAELAHIADAELYVLHVLPEVVTPIGPEPLILPNLPAEYYAETEKASLTALQGVVRPEWKQPKSIQYAVRWGDTVTAIVAYASELDISLLVTATHGRTGLKHVLMGSVAERIVREAPCPVLCVRDRKAD